MKGAARLVALEDVGAGLTRVSLAAVPGVRETYTRPGQVVQVSAGGETGYFALASLVGADTWELLVRDAGVVARALLSAPLGADFDAEMTSLAGFPRTQGEPGPFTLVAVGSALGAVRGLLLSLEAEGRCGEARLLLGVHSASRVPLVGELTRLAGAGLRVTLCLSDAPPTPGAHPSFEQHAGLVQSALAHAREDRDAIGAVFVAGPPEMMNEFRDLGRSRGFVVHANA
ncbi:MAG: hypothetical protein IPF92_24990 [Myxococcales bacterium]|nr:hypothetical protein [Myxococcales bacterium]HQY60111.1 hypothetical protein [Polyangiaceae bacterium]